MTPLRYSSLSAFIAHHRALASAHNPNEHERAALAEMDRVLATLDSDLRESLDEDGSPGEAARRRERGRRALAHELAARGILTG